MHKYTRARIDCEEACKDDPLLDARELLIDLQERSADLRTMSEPAYTFLFGGKDGWIKERTRIAVEVGRQLSKVGQMEAELPGALKVELLGSQHTRGWCGE
jgi:hypothetical protein